MPRFIRSLAVAATAFAFLCIWGCSGADPDRTGPGEGGLGAPGANATDAPKDEAEAYARQQQEEAAFRKTYKPFR